MTFSEAPSTQRPIRVALTSLGCKVNYAEMSALAGELAGCGFDIVEEHESADIRVLNSCTVTLHADATTRQRIAHIKALDPESHLIVTGCSVDGNPNTYGSIHGLSLTETERPLGGMVDAVFANGEKEEIGAYIASYAEKLPRNTAPRPPMNGIIPMRSRSFIKVQDGCRHSCTYCSVWIARGPSRSLPEAAIHQQIHAAIQVGHTELILNGVDLGSFGRDRSTTLASLVEQLLSEYPTLWIRLSSINANDIHAPLIALNAHPRFCSHWHIPLQSGSDSILKAMHRGYRSGQYIEVVEKLRAINPETTVTTDILSSFPGETDDNHQDTINLIHAVQFLKCHVFRYSSRPGTAAAALPNHVSNAVAKHRSAELRHHGEHTASKEYQRAVSSLRRVVWSERTAGGSMFGVADTYHTVSAPDIPNRALGSSSMVMINKASDTTLFGQHVHD